jgi:hypothetical protein
MGWRGILGWSGWPGQGQLRGGGLEEKGAEVGLIQIERTGIFMRRHLPNFWSFSRKKRVSAICCLPTLTGLFIRGGELGNDADFFVFEPALEG